jgi:hypothetical protein
MYVHDLKFNIIIQSGTTDETGHRLQRDKRQVNINSHRFALGMASECQMILKLETIRRPAHLQQKNTP